jgi:hypothetical protein
LTIFVGAIYRGGTIFSGAFQLVAVVLCLTPVTLRFAVARLAGAQLDCNNFQHQIPA